MSFENIFRRDIKSEINGDVYRQSFKERPHISKSKLDTYINAKYIKVGQVQSLRYSDTLSTRYMAALDVTYDHMLSIYDVNSRTTILYRDFRFNTLLTTKLKKEVEAISGRGKRPNMEARIIGLQTNEDYYLQMSELIDFLNLNSIKLVEVDLFGNFVRHVAIDVKLGMSFNILMNDRLYTPGELINMSNFTIENFEALLKKEMEEPGQQSK